MNRQESISKTIQLKQHADALQQEYCGFLSLYTAACMNGDAVRAEEYRVKAIETMGKMFDALWATGTITRNIMGLK